MFVRSYVDTLTHRLAERRRFLQVVAGPRQVGKTTLVRQALAAWEQAATYGSADEPTLRDQCRGNTARRFPVEACGRLDRLSFVYGVDPESARRRACRIPTASNSACGS